MGTVRVGVPVPVIHEMVVRWAILGVEATIHGAIPEHWHPAGGRDLDAWRAKGRT